MPKQQTQLSEVISLLSKWISEIHLSAAINFFDINKASEGTAMQLLNLVYGYNLKDLNSESANFPGIDLGDSNAGIAFQITSELTTAKIRHTIQQFYANRHDDLYPNGLRILFLVNSKKLIRQSVKFGNEFNVGKHIFYPKDIVREINKIYNDDPKKFEQIYQYITHELGSHNFREKKPLLEFDNLQSQLDFYRLGYRTLSEKILDKYVDLPLLIDNSNSDLPVNLTNKFTHSIVVQGKSGFGKSFLARGLSMSFLDKGGVPIFLEAKYYEGTLEALILREIHIFGYDSASVFFQSCKQSERNILLIIDGLNECTATLRVKLMIELKELVRQKDLRFLITTQQVDDLTNDLDATVYCVKHPDKEIKTAIAKKYCKSVFRIEKLLLAATTNLEAKIIGEIGSFQVDEISQFNLFDQFVRKKLITHTSLGMSLLSKIARFLSENVAFSLTIRQTEEIMRAENINDEILKTCLEAKLLVANGNKVSFVHELFLNFFIADGISRYSLSSQEIVSAIKAPRNYDKRILIVGSIDSLAMLHEVLGMVDSSDILNSLALGEGGKYAKEWLFNQTDKLLLKMEFEAKKIQFEFTEGPYPIQVKPNTVEKWSANEYALIHTLPYFLLKEFYLTKFFQIIGVMDETCKTAFSEMVEEGRQKKVGVRSGLFSATYAPFGHLSNVRSALGLIFPSLHSGHYTFNRLNEISDKKILELLSSGSLKNGQFYFLLLLFKYDDRAQHLYPYVLNAIKHNWSYIPYHLQNEILDRVGDCYANEKERLELIEVVNEIHSKSRNAWDSTRIFDALTSLNALEDHSVQYKDTVASQLAELLQHPNDDHSCNEVYGIYSAQMDHPYSYGFTLAISELDDEDKERFYKMALRGANDSFFLVSLILQAISAIGVGCCADIEKFTKVPIMNESFPQDSLSTFILSHITLGRFNYPLVSKISNQLTLDAVLFACGEVFYWLNRTDISIQEMHNKLANSLSILFDPSCVYTIEALWQTQFSLRDYTLREYFKEIPVKTIFSNFPNEIAKVSRMAVQNPFLQKSIYRFDRDDEVFIHSMSLLRMFGNITDVSIFLPFVDHPVFGREAVEAIRELGG